MKKCMSLFKGVGNLLIVNFDLHGDGENPEFLMTKSNIGNVINVLS